MKNIISYLLILIGGAIAIYANAKENQNTVVLVLGIIVLMTGIYILNRKLSSKSVDNKEKYKQEEE